MTSAFTLSTSYFAVLTADERENSGMNRPGKCSNIRKVKPKY